ncbi:MAG TPA: VWA domain-containing protein [Flavobacteriaceae bacterium]|nr:VWA domain-containing protein [Flavobacteriaceae bacterium]
MLIFEEKIYFWLLLAIPVVLLLFFWMLWWRKRTQRKFADADLLKKLSPDKSVFKSSLKIFLFLLALACFILALVNPKIGTELETVKRKGVDIVFAIDVSRSMLAEDIAPNRLEKAKRLVTEIINNLKGDRVGIIGYAGSAFPQVPITTDYGTAKMFLQSMNTNMVSSQGTAIKEAVELAMTYYNDESRTNRLLFILSDGEDHEGGIDEIIEKASENGIRIYTIGLGTTKGGPIPIKNRGTTVRYLKNNEGETVITKLEPQTLREIASDTKGKYLYGAVTSEVTKQVEEILQNVEKTEFESKQYAGYKSQFQWFLGFGILFLFLELFLLERRTEWLKKLDLFNED